MNLPNRLTLLRVLLIPLCILMLYLGWMIPGAILFAIAAFTDFLDGHIARRNGLVTNFGKFADPVADKILAISLMIVLMDKGLYPWWALCVVAMRELAVDGLRLVAVERGIVIPAGNLGKFKTNAQFLSLLLAMLYAPAWLTLAVVILMCALTVVSGAQYFMGAGALLGDWKDPAA